MAVFLRCGHTLAKGTSQLIKGRKRTAKRDSHTVRIVVVGRTAAVSHVPGDVLVFLTHVRERLEKGRASAPWPANNKQHLTAPKRAGESMQQGAGRLRLAVRARVQKICP